MPLQTLPRRERRKIQKKEELLEEAKAVFAEKGFLSTSIENIAEHADISVGSIYNFFKNKDDLYVQVVETIFQESLETFDSKVLVQPNLKKSIKEIVTLRLMFFFKYKSFSLGVMEAVSSGIFAREEGFKKACLAFREVCFQKNLHVLNRFQELLPGFNLNYLAFTLEGTISEYIYHLAHNQTAHNQIKKSPAEMIEELSLHFFKIWGLENIEKDIKGEIKDKIKMKSEK